MIILAVKEPRSPFRDSNAVISAKIIKKTYPTKKVVVELADMDNISLLEDTLIDKNEKRNLSYFSEELMSGNIFFSA